MEKQEAIEPYLLNNFAADNLEPNNFYYKHKSMG